jgi:hypothetical protein
VSVDGAAAPAAPAATRAPAPTRQDGCPTATFCHPRLRISLVVAPTVVLTSARAARTDATPHRDDSGLAHVPEGNRLRSIRRDLARAA